jgi:hypothetical protein
MRTLFVVLGVVLIGCGSQVVDFPEPPASTVRVIDAGKDAMSMPDGLSMSDGKSSDTGSGSDVMNLPEIVVETGSASEEAGSTSEEGGSDAEEDAAIEDDGSVCHHGGCGGGHCGHGSCGQGSCGGGCR